MKSRANTDGISAGVAATISVTATLDGMATGAVAETLATCWSSTELEAGVFSRGTWTCSHVDCYTLAEYWETKRAFDN